MHEPLCVCGLISELRPKLATVKTRVIIIMHHREENLTSNTARLAAMSLPDCEIRIRGLLDNPLSTEGFYSQERPSYFLYPSEQATELTPEFARELAAKFKAPPILIVPDGNWRQASKVSSRISEIKNMPHLKLPEGAGAQYHLRHGPRAECLSTFEAIARAIGILEDAQAQNEMEILFEQRVERGLWARGKIKQEECRHPIPQSFFDFFRAAGIAGSIKSHAQALASARKSRSDT